jgi:hypothetical protein
VSLLAALDLDIQRLIGHLVELVQHLVHGMVTRARSLDSGRRRRAVLAFAGYHGMAHEPAGLARVVTAE